MRTSQSRQIAFRQKWQLLWARRPEWEGQGRSRDYYARRRGAARGPAPGATGEPLAPVPRRTPPLLGRDFAPRLQCRVTNKRPRHPEPRPEGSPSVRDLAPALAAKWFAIVLRGILKINLPNALTLLRIFLVPFLVVVLLTKFDGRETVGLLIFLTAVATDFFDGWLARRRGEITTLGDAARSDRRQTAHLGGLHLARGAGAGARVDGRGRHRPRVRGFGPALDRVGARHHHLGLGLGQGQDADADRGGVPADPRPAARSVQDPGPHRPLDVVAVALVSGTDYFVRFLRRIVCCRRGRTEPTFSRGGAAGSARSAAPRSRT